MHVSALEHVLECSNRCLRFANMGNRLRSNDPYVGPVILQPLLSFALASAALSCRIRQPVAPHSCTIGCGSPSSHQVRKE
jgi:hypothetical protein